MGQIASPTDWMLYGFAPLDRDLKELVALVEELDLRLAEADAAGARQQLRALLLRAEHHFRGEQALLRRNGFPRLHDHARLHEMALLMLERLEAALDDHNLGAACALAGDLAAFFDGVLRLRKAEYADFLAQGRTLEGELLGR